MKTLKIYTLGCKVNQYDSQSIREQFLSCGFKEVQNNTCADVCVINTCTVTSRADSASLQFIRRAKKDNPQGKIIVTGCLAELDKERIRGIDRSILVFNNSQKEKLVELLFPKLNSALTTHASYLTTAFHGHTRAFLKVQDGCNNFCSYCKVPLVRGRSRSRLPDEILKEAQNLVKNGRKEIVLTGICLGDYGKERTRINTDKRTDSHGYSIHDNLAVLIKDLEKIKGLLRIRLSSIEAGDVTNELIRVIARSKKVCRHLHIPIQSGDDKILKKMHRHYTHTSYLKLIQKIKKKIPGIAITTDCLLGFPGEREDNFQNTLKLVKKILPLKTHIFPYSVRQGTRAEKFGKAIDPKIIKARAAQLKLAANECADKFKQSLLKKRMGVLIESRNKQNPLFWEGHTDNYLKVLVKSDSNLKNKLISLRLKRIDKDCIIGEL